MSISTGEENLDSPTTNGFLTAGLLRDVNMMMCIKNFKNRINRQHFPNVLNSRSPLYGVFIFSLLKYLLSTY